MSLDVSICVKTPICLPDAVGELEDPRRMLDQAVSDMREDVTKMRQAAAQVLQHLSC